jgi:hypothetical protein
VERRQPRRDAREVGCLQPTLGEPNVCAIAVVEPPHVHSPLDDLALAFEGQASVRAAQRDDAEVDLWGEAAVEFDLPFAGGLAQLQRGEIEEPQLDRLLDLEDLVLCEQNPGDVGLDEVDRVRGEVTKDGVAGKHGPSVPARSLATGADDLRSAPWVAHAATSLGNLRTRHKWRTPPRTVRGIRVK